jgi:hypothetical protein
VFDALTAFFEKAVAKTFFKIIKGILTPLFSKVAKSG